MPLLRLGRLDDVPALLAVEQAADQLFRDAGVALGDSAACPEDLDDYAASALAGRLLVAEDAGRVVGFLAMTEVDGAPWAEELSVHPAWQRRGLGRALILAALDRCRAAGAPFLQATTFRDLPWNLPFYRRLGFRELPEGEWGPGVRALRAEETAKGLDPAARCVIRRDLP